MSKNAVDLEPDVAESLGIQTVSPAILDQLEREAAGAANESPEEQEATPNEPVAEQQPAAEPMAVESFDRIDEEPQPDGEQAVEPELPNRVTHGKLFTDKRAHPLQILDTLTMRYGTEWTNWESATLWWALRRDFGPVGDVARNKIMALRIAVGTDMPWLDWDVFEDSGLAWNDIVPMIGQFQPMTPMQMAFAVHILKEIRSDEIFDAEVKAYIAALLEEHGWVYAPEEFFDGAQELMDRRVWLVGFKQEVMKAWERVRNVDPTAIDWRPDNPLDIHLLKLVVVKRYVDERNAMRQGIPGTSASSSTVSPPVP